MLADQFLEAAAGARNSTALDETNQGSRSPRKACGAHRPSGSWRTMGRAIFESGLSEQASFLDEEFRSNAKER